MVYPIGYDEVRKDLQWGNGTVSFCREVGTSNSGAIIGVPVTVNCNERPGMRRVLAGKAIYAYAGTTQYNFNYMELRCFFHLVY